MIKKTIHKGPPPRTASPVQRSVSEDTADDADQHNSKIHRSRNQNSPQTISWKFIVAIISTMVLIGSILYAIRLAFVFRYVVDDIYEVKPIRELLPAEKYSIRVLSPPDDRDLQAFVEHYSICPYIHEIRVSWTKSKERIPKNSIFSFTKNHAKVTFEKINGTFECTKNKFETPAVLLLDADVFVECSDIKHLGEVWQSTTDTAVGFFPRLHRKKALYSFDFLGWPYVLWNGGYSILLSSGIMLSNQLYQSICDSNSVAEHAVHALKANPHCFDVFISLWVTHMVGNPPIWVPTKTTTNRLSTAKYPWDDNTNAVRGSCLSLFSEIIDISELYASSYKAANAKNELFW